MMLNRSSHIPIRTSRETTYRVTGLRRAALQNSTSGAIELQKYWSATANAYVAAARQIRDARSVWSPLYQAVKRSHR